MYMYTDLKFKHIQKDQTDRKQHKSNLYIYDEHLPSPALQYPQGTGL